MKRQFYFSLLPKNSGAHNFVGPLVAVIGIAVVNGMVVNVVICILLVILIVVLLRCMCWLDKVVL